MADDTIKIDVVGDSSKYAKSVKQAANATSSLEKQLEALATAGTTLAGLAAGPAAFVAAITKSQVDLTKQIKLLEGASGLSTKTLGGLRKAAMEAGLELESLVPIDLADKIEELRSGSASFVEDFGLIGLAAKDFAGKTTDQAFGIIIDRMQNATDKSKLLAFQTRIMSTAGENLGAVFNDNAKSLDAYSEAASKSGLASEANIKAGENLAKVYNTAMVALDDLAGSMVAVWSDEGLAGDAVDGIGAIEGAANQFLESLERARNADVYGGILLPTPDTIAAARDGWSGFFENLGITEYIEGYKTSFTELQEHAVYTIASIGGEGEIAVKRLEESQDEYRKRTKVKTEQLAREVTELQAESSGAAEATSARWAEHFIAGRDAAIEAELELQRAQQDRVDAEMAAYAKLDELAKQKAEDDKARFTSGVQTQLAMVESTAAAWVDILKDGSEQQKKMARVIFGIQKAAAIAQAGVNTALAISQALGSAPPPYNFILAGVAGAAGAAAAVAVAASPAPSFHIGSRAGDLAPDETMAKVTRREVVLTPQGAAQLNAGRNVSNGGSEPFAYVIMDHEVVGRAAAKSARRPGSALHRAMGKDLPGHSRRNRPG